jgi:hypothetical protein
MSGRWRRPSSGHAKGRLSTPFGASTFSPHAGRRDGRRLRPNSVAAISARESRSLNRLRRHSVLPRRAPGENAADIFAHAPLGHALARRELGDRHAAVREADDPPLPVGLPSARHAPRRRQAIAADGWSGFDGLGQGAVCVGEQENEYRT